jgi:hypothetical protein
MTTREKKRIKQQELIDSMKGSEPVLTEENYKSNMMAVLNYHAENTDGKKPRQWATTVFKKTRPDLVAIFNKASDFEMKYIGIILHHKQKGQYVSPEHMAKINDDIQNLVAKYATREIIQKVKATSAVDIQQRMEERAYELAGEIEGAIDEFITNATDFSTKSFLLSNEVSAPIAKRVGELFLPRVEEIREVISGTDAQLVEGYSNFTKRELKKYLTFLESIVADCEQQVVSAKASRKPRARKPKSPTQLVAKMKYLQEFENLKSIKPTEIIASKEVWIYNTKYRRLFRYVAADASGLSVKGTTLLNYSTSESVGKTLRKPEEVFQNFTKKWLNDSLKKLKTKDIAVNGRVNEDCIILKAF